MIIKKDDYIKVYLVGSQTIYMKVQEDKPHCILGIDKTHEIIIIRKHIAAIKKINHND